MSHRDSYTAEALAKRAKFMTDSLAAGLAMVLNEMERTENRALPSDPLRRIVLVAEEAGEALKAVLDFTRGVTEPSRSYQNEEREKLKSEVIQTAAMSLRVLAAMLEEEED